MARTTDLVDVLVICAGASGGAFAWSLAEAGINVMCLEQGGDSTGRETAAQPVKDCQPFQAGQWHAVGVSRRMFTQFVQFFRYWRFSKNRWDSTLRTSWRHSLPLSRRPTVVHCLFIRYARLNFYDSLNFPPV